MAVRRQPTRDPDSLNDREAEDQGERAAQDIETLNAGSWRSGYWDARLEAFSEGLGIETLEKFVQRCDKAIAEQRQQLAATWPAPYRYTGNRGTHLVNGAVMKVGTVVLLDEAQAEAWADRFALVEQEQATS
ncbi:MAG: hypothetical protein M3451_00495 [Chloroflexota bacterium]|nr:hypothetical protein [Acidobacteriota bacterium]MDQ3523520.1 hypothetical protein [Chloroflexota bacterium]